VAVQGCLRASNMRTHKSASLSVSNLARWRTHSRMGVRGDAGICAGTCHPRIPIRTCTSLPHCKHHVQNKQNDFRQDTPPSSLLPESQGGIHIRACRCRYRCRCTRARHAWLGIFCCNRLGSAYSQKHPKGSEMRCCQQLEAVRGDVA
jgi:hypothetical protein